MPLVIQDGPATSALARAIDAQARILREELRASKEPKRGTVHRLRVTSRRLLAALELVEAVGVRVPKRASHRLRRLLHHLSPLRDAQVMQRALGRLGGVDRALLDRVRRRQRKQKKRARRGLSRFELSDFEREFGELQRSLESSDISPRGNQLVSFALAGSLATKHLAIERRRAAATRSSERELHQLRIALKNYRYSLEMLGELLPSSAEQLLSEATRLQDELGSAHDQYVLAELVAESAGSGEASSSLAGRLLLASRDAHHRAADAASRAELSWPLASSQLTLLGRKKSAR